MTGFVLREAGPSDVPDVLRLVRGLAEYERLLDRFTATEADFTRVLFGPERIGHALLAEQEGCSVGIAVWYFMLSTFAARPILFLEDIFVEPARRGQGIGMALLRRLARIAKAENCWSMDWNVLDWNEPAIAFYRRIGARPMPEWVAQRLDAQGIAALAEE